MNPSYVHFRPTSARAALEVILGEGILSELLDETNDGWSTALLPFELAEFPDATWDEVARTADVVYESYSTSLLCGEVVLCMERRVLWRLRLAADEPARMHGEVPEDLGLNDWSDVWNFVEDARWVDAVQAAS